MISLIKNIEHKATGCCLFRRPLPYPETSLQADRQRYRKRNSRFSDMLE